MIAILDALTYFRKEQAQIEIRIKHAVQKPSVSGEEINRLRQKLGYVNTAIKALEKCKRMLEKA